MMKYLYPLFFLLTSVNVLLSQQNNSQENESTEEIILVDEAEPEFPGGMSELQKFISKNMQYPMEAIEKNIQGKVYVRFKIDNTTGQIDSVIVFKGIIDCPMCDAEAARVVNMMPNWIPVKGSNQKAYWMSMPFNFVLEGGDEIISNSNEDSLEITKRYDAHWAGFDIGSLILMSNGFNSRFESNLYWENNIGKSSSININLLEYKLPIFKQYFGLTTGFGMAFSTIGYRDDYVLFHNQDSVFAVQDTTQSYRRNQLTAGYFTVPLLLEYSAKPKQKKSFYVAAGVVGGIRFSSYTTKTGKYENGDRFQNVVRSKYNLNPVTLDATLRVGYGWIGLYASYQLNSLFKNNKTVEVYPFKVGVTFNIDFFEKEKSNEE